MEWQIGHDGKDTGFEPHNESRFHPYKDPLCLLSISSECKSSQVSNLVENGLPNKLAAAAEASKLAADLERVFGSSCSKDEKFTTAFKLIREEEYSTIRIAEKILENKEKSSFSSILAKNLNSDSTLASFLNDPSRRIESLIKGKAENEQLNDRTDAAELLKPESGVKINHTEEITMDDGRKFDIFVPKRLRTLDQDGKKIAAPMLIYHGVSLTDHRENMIDLSGMNQVAEQQGFVAIYPIASELQPGVLGWKTDRENILRSNKDVDDVKEGDKTLSYVNERIINLIDSAGCAGHSDGGRMCQDRAAERGDKTAFVLAFNSTFMAKSAPPTHPVPIAFVSNDIDGFLPRKGGAGLLSAVGNMAGFFRTGAPSTNISDSLGPEAAERIWAKTNGCQNIDQPKVYFSQDANSYTMEEHHYICPTPVESFYYGNTSANDLLINQLNLRGNHGIPDSGNIERPAHSNEVVTAGRTPVRDLVAKYLPYLLRSKNDVH